MDLTLFLTTVILIPVVLVAIGLLATCIVITQQQHVRLIETFGKFSAIKHAGLSLKAPWPIQSASANFSLKIMEISQDVTVKSSDNAFVTVPIRVQYRVNDSGAEAAYYRLDDPVGQIRSYVVNQVRSTASGLTFDQLFQSRGAFEGGVEDTLTDKMSSYGFRIVNVLVDDPQPSDELKDAFDRVIASERLKESAQNEGEAARIISVAKANAEGESLEIKGRAFSSFRKTIAEGNSEALQEFVRGTGLSPAEGLIFFTSINEMEAVRDAAAEGGRVVFVAGSAKSEGTNPALMGMISDAGKAPEITPPKKASKGSEAKA